MKRPYSGGEERYAWTPLGLNGKAITNNNSHKRKVLPQVFVNKPNWHTVGIEDGSPELLAVNCSVLVMSTCGSLKHISLDGYPEHTSVRTLGGHSNVQWCSARLLDRPFFVSSFHERPPSSPTSNAKVVTRWAQNISLHMSHITARDCSKKWDLQINPA